jgi:hypothetical protein
VTLPWAESMQPDTPVPVAAPEPIPVVATNIVTTQQIGVDIAAPLRTAIDQAITDAVTAHPVLGRAVQTVVRDSERADRTLMQSSMFDITVGAVAALFTVINPDSPTTGVLWLAAAVLASRTMIQAAVHHLVPEAT